MICRDGWGDESAVQDAVNVEDAMECSVGLDVDRSCEVRDRSATRERTQKVGENAAARLHVADVRVRDEAVILTNACERQRRRSTATHRR